MMYQHAHQLGLTSRHKLILVGGVILPAFAITVEATTHVCARIFFDPIPTNWHMLLVILAPLAQLQVWFAIRRNDPNALRLAGFANAAAIAISLFYSFLYLPLVPVAMLTLLIALGFLPLSPFLALISALVMRKQLRRLAAAAPKKSFPITTKGFLTCLGIGIAVIGLAELPGILTRYGLQMATSGSPQTRTEGIRFLRKYGDENYLLQRCYDRKGSSIFLLGDWLSSNNSIKDHEVRDIYYRVTGKTFDSSVPPLRVNGNVIRQDDYEFDPDSTQNRTAGVLRDLSLWISKLDGHFDADGGVGRLDWTLNFNNASVSDKEARAEIQLPPGAIVSHVTYQTPAQDYEAQIEGRSDSGPVGQFIPKPRTRISVTTAGRDRVLLQVYPVPRFSKATKIRLRITVPLVLQTKDQARLILPHFNSRNFDIPENFKHGILVSSNQPLSSDYGLAVHSVGRLYNSAYQLYGEFTDNELMQPETALRLVRNGNDHGIWSNNPYEVGTSIVKQSLEERTPSHLRRIVLVVDTSASMAEWQSQIKAALNVLPSDMDLQLVLADADWLYDSARKTAFASGIDNVATYLGGASFGGGADNAPALLLAWKLATATPGNNAIVWIHGPQPINLSSTDELVNQLRGGFFGPSIYSVQTAAGSDEIVKRLDGINEVKSVVRLGSLRTDLERLFQQLSGQVKSLEFVRSVKYSQPEIDGTQTLDDLAQLWANDEVERILGANGEWLKEAATILAQRYQIVTSTSGAAILDSTQQLDNSDLQPLDAFTLTEISQPDFGGLFFLAFLFFVWLIYMKAHTI